MHRIGFGALAAKAVTALLRMENLNENRQEAAPSLAEVDVDDQPSSSGRNEKPTVILVIGTPFRYLGSEANRQHSCLSYCIQICKYM